MIAIARNVFLNGDSLRRAFLPDRISNVTTVFLRAKTHTANELGANADIVIAHGKGQFIRLCVIEREHERKIGLRLSGPEHGRERKPEWIVEDPVQKS